LPHPITAPRPVPRLGDWSTTGSAIPAVCGGFAVLRQSK